MNKTKERNMTNECDSCIHKRNVPGDTHISCNNPDKEMVGSSHGIRMGWFLYPLVFDPIWKEKDCSNYNQSETTK